MPKTEGRPSRRGTRVRRTRATISYSSSEEMDFSVDFNFQLGVRMALALTKTPKQKKRSKTTKTKKQNSNPMRIPDIHRTKNINTSIIDLDDSDEEYIPFVESKTNNIKERVQGKVDTFFKSSGLISDDEDEAVVAVDRGSNNTEQNIDLNEPFPSRSVASGSNEGIIVIEDNANGINSLADIQNYCKETEDLLKNANAVLEKFTGTFKDEEPQNTKLDAGQRENSRQQKGLGECPICYESLSEKQVMSTKCGHLFCKDCIGKIVTSAKKCPTCRKPVNKKNIIPIYI